MTFRITVQPSGHTFAIEPNQTILEAGLEAGIVLPYSCRDGVCGVCKGRIVEGNVDHGKYLDSALSEAEKAAGMALSCCAKPRSDLVIESREVSAVGDIPVRTLPCRVEKMKRLAEDVMLLQLKLPAGERLKFLAGQYIDILVKDHKPRSFSLANAPHDDAFLELHIRNIPGGMFTRHVFAEMKERDILRFKGPLGTFFLREDSAKPAILISGSTGFAPVKAMVEHALHAGTQRHMHVYWGARKLADLYMLDKARRWESVAVKFTPVLSEPLPEDNWTGRTGLVHQAVLDDYADLSDYEVYACGSPAMVTAAHTDCVALGGLSGDNFYSDMFSFAPKD